MTIRTTVIIFGLATLAGGCTITTRHEDARVYQYEPRVVHEDDAYEGYYYVRIIYLNGIPWYVDEDLRARPVPPHLRSQFRYSSWVRSAPPRFSRETGMRDGYNLSRIVYINDVPYHVDENRSARPIPQKLRSRFSYRPVAIRNDNERRPGERSMPPFAQGSETRPVPPAYGRERQELPDYGNDAPRRVMLPERTREEERPAPPAYGRDRREPPAHEADNGPGRGMPPERMREETRPAPPAYGRDRQGPLANGVGNAVGRVMQQERMREETRPVPPGRDRQEPPAYGADNEPGRGMPPERMREETGRQTPPLTSNVRIMAPQQNEDRPAVRGNGRDERRPLPQDEGRGGDNAQRGGRDMSPAGEAQRITLPASREAPPQQPQDIAQRDRGQPQSADDDARGMGAVNGQERSADPAPERKNGKGKGRTKDQETDSVDERDGDAPKRRGRSE
jgi:hypothetical protein